MATKKRVQSKKKVAPRTAGSKSLDSFGAKNSQPKKATAKKIPAKGYVESHGGGRGNGGKIASVSRRYSNHTIVIQKYEKQ